MPKYALLRVYSTNRFCIRPDHHNHWIVSEHNKLASGGFLTREGALSQTEDDAALFDTTRAPAPVRYRDRRL